MPLAILCDFDGTIITTDSAVHVFNEFVTGDWRKYNDQLERGEITLEECIKKQFLMIKAEKKAILTALEQVIEVRQGFEVLVHYCHEQAIPFNIVSAGLDFIIEHVMLKKKLQELVTIHAIETRFTSKGIEPVFQEFRDGTSLDFKDDLVKHYKKHGYRVIYIGDGVSDQGAIRSADKVFTIKNSSLSSYCERAAIVFVEIDDFRDIIKEITK